jgi:hypothetical protein
MTLCKQVTTLLMILLPYTSLAQVNSQIRDLETTRLMSSAGAGVGAILLNESSVLNPATVTFFEMSSIYYQGNNIDLEEPSSTRTSSGPNFDSDSYNQAFIITDTTKKLKGGMSYQSQYESDAVRHRLTFSGASHLGKSTSMGFMYKYSRDKYQLGTNLQVKKYHQMLVGLTHIFSNKLIFGATLNDPFQARAIDGKYTFGVHYFLLRSFSILFDAGANVHYSASKTTFSKSAFQFSFSKTLLLRAGVFNDNQNKTEGSAWGLSWIGPKISIDLSVKKTKPKNNFSTLLYNNESIDEASVALAAHF